jgi:Kef-type K+ transport system membrane component KefB
MYLKYPMKNNIIETIVTVCLIAIAILLLNPFHFWMPDMMVVAMLAVTLGLFGVFASFILREKMVDERDGQHRTLAGRNAFLVGSGVLTLGIVIQGYSHSVDPWLVIALITMIVIKIATRIWSDKNL